MSYKHAESADAVARKEFSAKLLRVKLQNIKDYIPLEQISRGFVSMDVCKLTTLDCGVNNKLKLKQTARKSTNSKLKIILNGVEEQSTQINDKKEVLSNSSSPLDQSPKTSNTTAESHTSLNNSLNNSCEYSCENSPRVSSNNLSAIPDKKDPKVDPIKLKLKDIIPNNKDSILDQTKDNNVENKVESLKLKLKTITSSSENNDKPPIKLFLSNVSSCPTIQNFNDLKKDDESDLLSSDDLPSLSVKNNKKNSNNDLNGCLAKTAVKKSSIADIVNTLKHIKGNGTLSQCDSEGSLKRSISNDLSTEQSDCKKFKKEDHASATEFNNPLIDKEAKAEQKVDDKNKENNGVKKEECFEKKWTNFKPEIEKFIHEQCQKEIDLQMKLDKKNARYTKLKEKYDSLEGTLRSWIQFANDLQTRVKKIAKHFQKQAEAVDELKAKNAVQKTSVAIQTDKVFQEKSLNSVSKPTLDKQHVHKNHSQPNTASHNHDSLTRPLNTPASMASPLTSTGVPNPKQNVAAPKKSSDVIDLTGDTDSLNSSKSSNIRNEVRKILRLPNPNSRPGSKVHRDGSVSRNSLDGSPLSFPVTTPNSTRGNKHQTARKAISHNAMTIQHRPVHPQRMVRANSASNAPNSISSPVPQLGGRFPGPLNQVRNIRPTSHNLLPYPPLPSTASKLLHKIPRSALGPPPELQLGIKRDGRSGGIVLSWSNRFSNAISARVVGYELYAFHYSNEKKEWRKIGDDTINAMDLPMACTLSQFSTNAVYFFAVRGKDVYGRFGPFSSPCSSKDVT